MSYTAPAPEPPPPFALLEMLNGMWVARAIQVAAELRLADQLADGPRELEELATATETHGPSLYRLLRALTSVGVFEEVEPGRYAQTPRSASLCSDGLGDVARMFGADWHWRSWSALPRCIATGRPAFDHVHDASLVEYLERNPEAGGVFDAAMTQMSALLGDAIVGTYDFSAFGTVVDVGGGHSDLLARILAAQPALRGILIDRPAAVDKATRGLDRCEGVAADFLASVPATGDAYLLNRVLHDWDDRHAGDILRACREAMPPTGRVLVIEQILRPGESLRRAAFLDLQMLQLRGGGERTEEELGALLTAAGLRLDRIVPTPSPMSIIEASRP